MQRIPLLILAFIIVIVTAKVPAFPEESAAPDKHHQRCHGKKHCTVQKNMKSFNAIEPSAGVAPDPYINPDQEKLDENKQDWWRGEWDPPQEDNPYHKW